MRRHALKGFYGALMGMCLHLCSAGQTLHSSQHPLYVNRAYRFQVVLPPGVTYERSLPPNPDHGFGVDLPGGTRLWANASYTDSPSTEDEVSRQTDGCSVEEDRPATLGTRTARALRFSCPATSYGAAYRERLVLSVARLSGRSPICYQGAVRTSDAKMYPAASRLFDEVVAGFRSR